MQQGEKLDPTTLGGLSGKSYSLTASSSLIELGKPGLKPFPGFIQGGREKIQRAKGWEYLIPYSFKSGLEKRRNRLHIFCRQGPELGAPCPLFEIMSVS